MATRLLGEQSLGSSFLVAGNDGVGGEQDVGGGSVVLLQLDHLGARVVALEVEDVADVRPAPPVDGLILVADDGDAVRPLRKEADQFVLHVVRVLEFVHEHMVEQHGEFRRGGTVGLAKRKRVHEQPAEIHGVRGLQAFLVLAVGPGDDFAFNPA